MVLDDIPAQGDAVRRLRACLNSGRVPHAYLFVGSEGTGRLRAARGLGRTLLCADPEAADRACGGCESCRALDAGNHPDYVETGLPEGRQSVPIDAVRDLQQRASRKPVLGGGRMIVVRDAERLTLEAANCFLKTLEEPPPGCRVVLIASSLRELPETVLSRCWIVRFCNLDPGELSARLQEEGAEPEEARWLARHSWGSPGVARRLREMDFPALNRQVVEELHGMTLEDNFRLSDWLDGVAREGTGSATEARTKLQDALECLALYYRDLALLAAEAPGQALINRADVEKAREVARRAPPDAFLDRADAVLRAIGRIGANANRTLTLDHMFTRIALPERKGQ